MPQVLINGKMQTLSFRHNDRYHFVNEWKDVSLVLGVRHEHTHTQSSTAGDRSQGRFSKAKQTGFSRGVTETTTQHNG